MLIKCLFIFYQQLSMLGYITAQAIVYGLIHVSKYQICTVLLAWAKKVKTTVKYKLLFI